MSSTEIIRDLAEPLLADVGLQLWDVEVSRDAVRVFVDRPGGIDLDSLTSANTTVSGLLDDHPDLVPAGAYQLEVSSPGIERALRTPDHFRRYVGCVITLKTVPAATAASAGGPRRWRGRLLAATDAAVTIDPDSSEESVEFRYDQIEKARTVLEWGPAPRRGSQPLPKGAGTARRNVHPTEPAPPLATSSGAAPDQKDRA